MKFIPSVLRALTHANMKIIVKTIVRHNSYLSHGYPHWLFNTHTFVCAVCQSSALYVIVCGLVWFAVTIHPFFFSLIRISTPLLDSFFFYVWILARWRRRPEILCALNHCRYTRRKWAWNIMAGEHGIKKRKQLNHSANCAGRERVCVRERRLTD